MRVAGMQHGYQVTTVINQMGLTLQRFAGAHHILLL